MAKILLILATVDTPLPLTQTFSGKFLFQTDGGAASIEPAAQHVTDDLADGDHTFTCVALDTNNSPLPGTATLSLTLAGGQIVVPAAPAPAPAPGPATTYPAPSALTASVYTG